MKEVIACQSANDFDGKDLIVKNMIILYRRRDE
jgi:hypothetical protein